MRLSLSVVITQMVAPQTRTVNLTKANGELETICPYNDENYIHEHVDLPLMFDQLYSVFSYMLIM